MCKQFLTLDDVDDVDQISQKTVHLGLNNKEK